MFYLIIIFISNDNNIHDPYKYIHGLIHLQKKKKKKSIPVLISVFQRFYKDSLITACIFEVTVLPTDLSIK